MITLENLTLSNPGEVLAVCGLFVLATRQDRKAMLAWTDNGAVIDTDQTLDELLNNVFSADIKTTPGEKSEPQSIQIGELLLDWWQYRNRSNKNKIWAGTVTAERLVATMIEGCKTIKGEHWMTATPCSQSTGIDAILVWTPIDLGWSPNKQKDGGIKIKMPARPWVELLILIGTQGFSALRTRNKHTADDWEYWLWEKPLTLLPARMVFRGDFKNNLKPVCATRYQAKVQDKGKNLRALTFAERHSKGEF
ncbi:hypothetical protein [Thiothrix unzii]|jgi:hypothetical protein|uniref:hypothetical protein n=1 Tax=Thiothrix unzii TaxID=111769 RepID=UPI002A363E55|nr:hypothetical protein [Thiothrix unzii]MDX9990393.1 hypothetical protein [Thiothrix unzii]